MIECHVQAVLTDIEGTTTSLSFVKDRLFPFAYTHLESYVKNHYDDITDILNAVRQHENNTALTMDEIITVMLGWMDADQKITPLKTLQGLIWRAGYEKGVLKGHLYPDAFETLKAWKECHIPLYIYSSGSVDAQKLLFSHTDFGNLTSFFSGYFDTTIGSKTQMTSYEKIAEHINKSPQDIMFLSDNPQEIDAAQDAGLQVVMLDREKNIVQEKKYPVIHDFRAIKVCKRAL